VDRFELKNTLQNFIYIEYENGISCGIKLQGKYITGRSHLAGEFGHLKVTDQPIPCRCGAIGCIEAVAALPALAKRLQDILREIPGDRLTYPEEFGGLEVLGFAAEGHRPARRVVEEAFAHFGSAVGGLVNILAPEAVIFDHRISLAGPEAVAVLFQSAQKSMLTVHTRQTDLRLSRLRSNIASQGGTVALLDSMLE
jgi:glucokinase